MFYNQNIGLRTKNFGRLISRWICFSYVLSKFQTCTFYDLGCTMICQSGRQFYI